MDNLALLTDDALLSRIEETLGTARQVLVRLLACLSEIEERRLELRSGYSSLFVFCTDKLRMSDGEAYRRILAARLMRNFPLVAELLESGAINITGLELLRPHLDDENHRQLLAEASFKKKTEILELLAQRFPRPDIPDSIRKKRMRAQSTASSSAETPAPPRKPPRAQHHAGTEPLSPDRYAVQFTASAELREKLEHAKNLMSHANPSLDLAIVVERALDLLIAELEKKQLGTTDRPRNSRAAKQGTVTRAARRAATERDGAQCAWVDEKTGKRCDARAFLEVDHIIPKAAGGSGDAENTRWLCRAHNQLHAEQTFGRKAVERARHLRQQKSEQSDTESDTSSKVLAGLRKLGFQAAMARAAVERATSELSRRREEGSPERVLREALLLLSDSRVPRMSWTLMGLRCSRVAAISLAVPMASDAAVPKASPSCSLRYSFSSTSLGVAEKSLSQ